MGEQLDIGNAALHRRTLTNGHTLNVWLVDDDESTCWILERALRKEGMAPRTFSSVAPVLDALESENDEPSVIFVDLRLSGESGLDLLRRAHEARPSLPVIVTAAQADLGNAVSAYKSGAFEYLPKPFDIESLVSVVRRAAHNTVGGNGEISPPPSPPKLLGNAPSMQQVFRAIGRLARSSATTVLITGESGTGKELVARALHDHSPRAQGPFVTLSTSAIPADLLESELFGCEPASPVVTNTSRRGRLERAADGTIFLDEIADMPPLLQTRLLQVLTEGDFYRAGGQTPIRLNARIVAGTQRNLAECVKQGTFREDLLRRLSAIQIHVPPLRTRVEDIPLLLKHYFDMAALELATDPKTLSKSALERLLAYQWPGNVSELVNLCMQLSVLSPGNEIRLEDLPGEFVTGEAATLLDADWARALQSWADRAALIGQRPLLDEAQPRFERALIAAALKRTRGHRREAAELLGWGRNTLTQKIRELGMGRPESRDEATPKMTQ